MAETEAINGPEEAPKPPAPTSGRVKSFKRHCLRCRKYASKFGNHKHAPDTFNTPCILCPCTYFYGWEQVKGRMKKKDWKNYSPKNE
jgi:hypothetical protein